MTHRNIKLSCIMAVAAVVLIYLTGCAAVKPGKKFYCSMGYKINRDISPEAGMEEFSCVVKKWEGEDTLHFNVAIKNVSTEEQRYKVNIFLANGKAVGGLIPRKTNKGLVKPGEIGRFSYPVKGMSGPAAGDIDLVVKTMAK